jgi:hypothetical protein
MSTEFPNWFEITAKNNFLKFLNEFKNQSNLNFLQLGAYTGDATVWVVENIFKDKSCFITDVDTWLGSDETAHQSINFNEVYLFYKNRIESYNYCVNVKKQTTFSFLLKEVNNYESFYDFVYIDADHMASSVLIDSELSWRILKNGGIMAFDDYTWGKSLPFYKSPKIAIDIFLETHKAELEILEKNHQVWVRKIT